VADRLAAKLSPGVVGPGALTLSGQSEIGQCSEKHQAQTPRAQRLSSLPQSHGATLSRQVLTLARPVKAGGYVVLLESNKTDCMFFVCSWVRLWIHRKKPPHSCGLLPVVVTNGWKCCPAEDKASPIFDLRVPYLPFPNWPFSCSGNGHNRAS